jgi:hypothetical protein
VKTRIVEATNGNHQGKFVVCRFDADEWIRISLFSDAPMSLLRENGYEHTSLLVVDLSTREGAVFTPPERPGGLTDAHWQVIATNCANAALNTDHQIWVSVLFPAFLGWLYAHDRIDPSSFDDLPDYVELTAPLAADGERRRMRLVQQQEGAPE